MASGKILISACLLGNPVRYDASDLFIDHPQLQQWQQQGRLVSLCPEVAGGMPTPRAPAEIVAANGAQVLTGEAQVIDATGQDVSNFFIRGAQQALQMAQDHHCNVAILTERSPSCGSHKIYDGSFSGTQVTGMGVTSALLQQNGILVFNQNQLEMLQKHLKTA